MANWPGLGVTSDSNVAPLSTETERDLGDRITQAMATKYFLVTEVCF